MNLPNAISMDRETVLLVGEDTFAVSEKIDASFSLIRRHTVEDAIAAMRQKQVDCVLVTFSAIQRHFTASLTGLRQANPSAQIILLAHMHEEPFIVGYVDGIRRPRHLFDDYVISPMSPDQWRICTSKAFPSIGSDGTETDKDRRIEALEKLVIQDDLTGLKNRRYLRQFLPQILTFAQANTLRVTLLIFDIDDFKHYNDAYGHAVGDNVLRQAGRMIQHCCRAHDVVARLGGDEFAVVFWDLPSEKKEGISEQLSGRDRRLAGLEHPREPIFMAERFCRELEQANFEYIGPKGKGALTISGGLATFPEDGNTAEELLEKADSAMFEAKRSGKNQIYLVGQPTSE